MKIKGYWEIVARSDGGKEGGHPVVTVIKARTIRKAIDIFYNENNNWFLSHNYKVISIRPLEVEVLKEYDKERRF